ncbi:MAG: hypothetical protein JO316_12305 [Abitibacteriaceae bacterium]|nr:hypothetical protein [Abditibacteriaceae bacterium]
MNFRLLKAPQITTEAATTQSELVALVPATASVARPLAAANLVVGSTTRLELERQERGVTPRVVTFSLIMAAVFGYALPVIDFKLHNTFLGAQHLPPGAVGTLIFLLVVVNPLLSRFASAWRLSRNETLTVYITTLFSSLLTGHGAETQLITNLIAPFYFATSTNHWLSWLDGRLAPWMTPALWRDGGHYGPIGRAVVNNWYVGTAGAPVPWGAWLVPLALWSTFTLISYFMLACLGVMLRAQWAEHEALSFPLLRLPLEMTRDLDAGQHRLGHISGREDSFWRNPLLWVGVAIPATIQTLNGLNFYFPDVPRVPLDINTGLLLTEAPWNQLGWVPLVWYPMVIGVTYLLATEVSFSLWFFYFLMKAQYVGAYMIGFPAATLPQNGALFPEKLITGYQTWGAFLMYVALIGWTGREHYFYVIRRAIGREQPREGEKTELLSYPVAFWGFCLSWLVMVAFTIAGGVRWDVALLLWITYVAGCIALTRVAVEGGLLSLQHQSAPLGLIARLLDSGPSHWLTAEAGIAPAAIFQTGYVVHTRSFLLPSFLHSLKLAHDRNIAIKPLGWLIAAVIVVSLGVSWTTCVGLGYHNGGLQLNSQYWMHGNGDWAMNFVKVVENAPQNTAWVNWVYLTLGAALTWGIVWMRSRYLWFPLHPVGYLMWGNYPSAIFCASIFTGWLCKVTITRFGGLDTYRKLMPLFLGLILGDVAMMLFWLGIDGWQGRTMHQLLPG